MFEQATLSYGSAGTRLCTTCAGFTGEALLLACAVLAPLVSPQVLPRTRALITLLAAPAPPPPPPKGSVDRPRAARAPVEQLQQIRAGQLIAPVRIPPRAAMIEDPPPEVSGYGVAGGIPGGARDGVLGSVLSEAARTAPPVRAAEPAAAPVTNAAPTEPLRLKTGGLVQLARPIHRVEPQYPALARQARISGEVELAGVIGTDGRIHELKVVRGHPLLVRAALDAVRQWIWAPTTLNGDPVEVIAPIIVTFVLR
jgi:protein TonB